MALRSGDCADAVADPFQRLGGEPELVHPVDGELETRDPHPGGRVGVARVTRLDGRQLGVNKNGRTCHVVELYKDGQERARSAPPRC